MHVALTFLAINFGQLQERSNCNADAKCQKFKLLKNVIGVRKVSDYKLVTVPWRAEISAAEVRSSELPCPSRP